MVNRTRVEGGDYSKHGIISARYDYQAGCNNIVDVSLYDNYMRILHSNRLNRVDYTGLLKSGLLICGHNL